MEKSQKYATSVVITLQNIITGSHLYQTPTSPSQPHAKKYKNWLRPAKRSFTFCGAKFHLVDLTFLISVITNNHHHRVNPPLYSCTQNLTCPPEFRIYPGKKAISPLHLKEVVCLKYKNVSSAQKILKRKLIHTCHHMSCLLYPEFDLSYRQ